MLLYDVIIVGAGPAGNIAALKLARKGYRVSVIDSRQNIGDKLCTGIIGKECADRFPPDVEHIHSYATAGTVVSPMGVRYRIARQDPQAVIVDRVAYVNSFAEQAMEAGAEYHRPAMVRDIDISDAGVTVSLASQSPIPQMRSQVLVIASGFGSSLLRKAGLVNGQKQEFMVGWQAEVIADDLQETEVHLGDDIAPGSFGWLVPLSDSRALVGLASRGKLSGNMNRFISRLQLSGRVREVLKEPPSWGIPVKPLRKTTRNRVLAVGDAAGLVKPTTGGGIYYALLSGEMAADAIVDAFDNGDFGARRMKRYEKAWKSTFGKELHVGYYARMMFESLNDEQIERLLTVFLSDEVVDELVNASDFSFDWHSRIILHALRQHGIIELIRSFGPGVAPFLTRLMRARFS